MYRHATQESSGSSRISAIELASEQELQSAVTKLLIQNFFLDEFDPGQPPAQAAEALAAQLRQFSCAFLFVRLKDAENYDPQLMPEDPLPRGRMDQALDGLAASLQGSGQCISCCIDQFKALMLVLDDESRALPVQAQYLRLETALTQAQRSVSESLGQPVQIICSKIEQDLNDLGASFLTTLFSVDYVFQIYPEKNVVSFFTTMQQVPDTSPLAPKPEWERLYFDAILDYNFKKAESLLFNLVQRELSNPNTALSIRNRLHSRMVCTLSILGLPVNQSLSDCVRIYQIAQDMTSCKTIMKINTDMQEFFSRLSAYYQTASPSTEQRLKMLTGYVTAHYADPELSVSQLSELFGVSLSHLSRIFKQKTGIKLIDYIHMTRIGHAKTLLRETGASLHEIAISVGYAGEWSLQRAFKKYESVTPGSLRADLREYTAP